MMNLSNLLTCHRFTFFATRDFLRGGSPCAPRGLPSLAWTVPRLSAFPFSFCQSIGNMSLMVSSDAQSCPALCDPMDCSPPGSSVPAFSRQEHWSGLPCPPPGELPDPGIKPESLKFPALAGGFLTAGATWEAEHTA